MFFFVSYFRSLFFHEKTILFKCNKRNERYIYFALLFDDINLYPQLEKGYGWMLEDLIHNNIQLFFLLTPKDKLALAACCTSFFKYLRFHIAEEVTFTIPLRFQTQEGDQITHHLIRNVKGVVFPGRYKLAFAHPLGIWNTIQTVHTSSINANAFMKSMDQHPLQYIITEDESGAINYLRPEQVKVLSKPPKKSSPEYPLANLSNLKKLKLFGCHWINPEIWLSQLLSSLRSLHLSNYSSPLLATLLAITALHIGDSFNDLIDDLPNSIETLILGHNFNFPVKRFPSSLRKLKIGRAFCTSQCLTTFENRERAKTVFFYSSSYDHLVQTEHPFHVRVLPMKFPDSLRKLCVWYPALDKNPYPLPAKLRSFSIRNSPHLSRDIPSALSEHLQKLKLRSFDVVYLPKSLLYLKVISCTLDFAILPQQLSSLSISGYGGLYTSRGKFNLFIVKCFLLISSISRKRPATKSEEIAP